MPYDYWLKPYFMRHSWSRPRLFMVPFIAEGIPLRWRFRSQTAPVNGSNLAGTPSKYGLSPSPDFTGDTLLGLLPTPRSSCQGSAHATLRLKVMAGNVPAEYPPIATRAGEHKTAGPALRKRLRVGPAAKISYYGIGTTFCGPGLCL